MEGVPQWEERSHRALHACLSEQPPPGKLLQTELHPRDAEVAGEDVESQEGLREWWALSCISLYLGRFHFSD